MEICVGNIPIWGKKSSRMHMDIDLLQINSQWIVFFDDWVKKE